MFGYLLLRYLSWCSAGAMPVIPGGKPCAHFINYMNTMDAVDNLKTDSLPVGSGKIPYKNKKPFNYPVDS